MQEHFDEYEIRSLNFIDAFLGLLTSPSDTTDKLFATEFPRYTFLFFATFIIALVAPFVAYGITTSVWSSSIISAIIGMSTLGALTFSITACSIIVLSLICAGDVYPARLLAALTYSTAPLSFGLLLITGSDYFSNNSFTLVQTICYGGASSSGNFSRALPIAMLICYLMMFVVLVSSLRAAFAWSLAGSAITGMVALVVGILAFTFSSRVSNLIHPGLSSSLEFLLFRNIPLTPKHSNILAYMPPVEDPVSVKDDTRIIL